MDPVVPAPVDIGSYEAATGTMLVPGGLSEARAAVLPELGSAATLQEHRTQNLNMNARLTFSIVNLVSILSKAVDVLAKCFMTAAAYLVSEVFLKFLPIIGAVISAVASLVNMVILLTKFSSCASKIEEVKALNIENENLDVEKEITLYSLVKKIEIAVQVLVFALSVVAIGLMFFSGAGFFLAGIITVVATSIILFVAYQIIHHVCKIDAIESTYELNVPSN